MDHHKAKEIQQTDEAVVLVVDIVASEVASM
jgi:hypothetical protein